MVAALHKFVGKHPDNVAAGIRSLGRQHQRQKDQCSVFQIDHHQCNHRQHGKKHHAGRDKCADCRKLFIMFAAEKRFEHKHRKNKNQYTADTGQHLSLSRENSSVTIFSQQQHTGKH